MGNNLGSCTTKLQFFNRQKISIFQKKGKLIYYNILIYNFPILSKITGNTINCYYFYIKQ